MLKIGYFADGPWSYEAFKKIILDKEIVIAFICVRFDTKDETLAIYCKQYDIKYLRHENINSEEFIDIIKGFNCDLFVSMSFNQIFKSKIINLPKYKAINCHAGKLPYYRGRNVLNWALINDESEFGITVHFIDEGIDTGDIIAQEVYPIDDDDSYASLLAKAYFGCADLLYASIRKFLNGPVIGLPQSEIHPTGFYCSQRKSGDEFLDWRQTSREIFNFVRALSSPGPQARAFINNHEIKINKVALLKHAPEYKCIVGAVIHKDIQGLLVKTSDSFVLLVEYESEFLIKVGDRFEL
jgi:methionyl-tRNA formyltransferase